jgi:hypothetical protein
VSTLDYQKPQPLKPGRIPLIIGIAAFLSNVAMFIVMQVVSLIYMDAPFPPPSYWMIFANVCVFPTFLVINSSNGGVPFAILLAVVNAGVWAITAAGICYAIRRLRARTAT